MHSTMPSKIFLILFYMTFLSLIFQPSESKTWVKAAGYWITTTNLPISDINSELFTHLICAYAKINTSTIQLSLSSTDELYLFVFKNTVKQKNPSITTLLSIGVETNANTLRAVHRWPILLWVESLSLTLQ